VVCLSHDDAGVSDEYETESGGLPYGGNFGGDVNPFAATTAALSPTAQIDGDDIGKCNGIKLWTVISVCVTGQSTDPIGDSWR